MCKRCNFTALKRFCKPVAAGQLSWSHEEVKKINFTVCDICKKLPICKSSSEPERRRRRSRTALRHWLCNTVRSCINWEGKVTVANHCLVFRHDSGPTRRQRCPTSLKRQCHMKQIIILQKNGASVLTIYLCILQYRTSFALPSVK
jgi:hypothetical protein